MKFYNFKTNIKSSKKAHNILILLKIHFNIKSAEIVFEKVNGLLKIKSPKLSPIKVTQALNDFGYSCEELSADECVN